jgi:ligand-binding sensor domain-containing protein
MNRNNTTKVARWINSTKYETNYTTVANIDQALWIASVNGFVSYQNNQFAFHYIGDGLTDTEAANLYTRVQAYQTALSRQV